MTERRADDDSRARIEEIRTEVMAEEKRKTRLLAGIIIMLIIGAVGFTLEQNRVSDQATRLKDVINQIQVERRHNTLIACERQNVQNAAIVGFIAASVPSARRSDPLIKAYLQRASRTFPQADCSVDSKQKVKTTSQ